MSDTSEYYQGPNNALKLKVVTLVLLATATILVVWRISWRIARRIIGLPDYLLIVGLSLSICLAGFNLDPYFRWGYGYHKDDLPLDIQKAMTPKICFWLNQVFFKATAGFIKLSICTIYMNIFSKPVLLSTKFARYGNFALMGIIAMYYTAGTLVSTFQCNPIQKAWQGDLDGKCIDNTKFRVANAYINSLTSILLVVMPFPVLLSTGNRSKELWQFLGLIALGLAHTGCAVTRVVMIYVPNIGAATDPHWYNTTANTLAMAEIFTAVIVATIMTMRPCIQFFATGILLHVSYYEQREGIMFLPLRLGWFLAVLCYLAASVTCHDASDTFRSRCLALKPAKLIHNATLTRQEFVPAGTTLQLSDNVPTCNRLSQAVTVDLCRIALQIPTSKRSSISFELWLPSEWNKSRYLATGNGGIDGCIKYEDLAYGTTNGFATMGTNNGHNGTTAITMLNNPEVIKDFSYRSLHTGTRSAKKIIKALYGKKPAHNYYLGCSLGGRMGIKAAEAYPKDYDGIVAGCPAVDFNNLQGQRAMFYPITGSPDSPNYIPIATWKGLIHDEVLRQCDEIDGVKDGIIEVPERCFFNPKKLQCGRYQIQNCLNSAQVAQVEKIYAPYTYPDGELIFPRMNPGNELQAVSKLIAGAPFSYSEEWFRYVVYNDPSWDASTYTTDDVRNADRLNPSDIRTYPRELPKFHKRGGKLLSYHGGQDNQITQFNTHRFWDRMYSADHDLHDYYRYFPISGMFHCNSGPGAWAVGQGGGASAAGVPFDPQHNVLAAIVDWVEKGRAPSSLTGTKFVNDTQSEGIDFQRKHCLYPKKQEYVGGDPKKLSSWQCR
ncbi:feruloyl esterase [Fusarium heterosporum]|uniref:Carboxylic ester hydrolase n=1 Tax=Fusarium heterosporum TaxID=42747 RepID=A0A8H5WGG9_FUSHE|nr:feruloyl esterase [Fusarium heterosporum]